MDPLQVAALVAMAAAKAATENERAAEAAVGIALSALVAAKVGAAEVAMAAAASAQAAVDSIALPGLTCAPKGDAVVVAAAVAAPAAVAAEATSTEVSEVKEQDPFDAIFRKACIKLGTQKESHIHFEEIDGKHHPTSHLYDESKTNTPAASASAPFVKERISAKVSDNAAPIMRIKALETAAPGMRIKSLETHSPPTTTGAPQLEAHMRIHKLARQYAKALCSGPKDKEPLLALFASTDNISWTDPVGTVAHVGRSTIAERIQSHFPPMDFVKVNDIFHTASSKIFLVKLEIKFTDKATSFFVLDKIVVNDDMKIMDLQSHFHPNNLGDREPVAASKAIRKFLDHYTRSLYNHSKDYSLLAMFAPLVDISWTDPVGMPAHVGRKNVSHRIRDLPPMDYVKVGEVFYTASDKVFLAKLELKIRDHPLPFFIIDKFVLA